MIYLSIVLTFRYSIHTNAYLGKVIKR